MAYNWRRLNAISDEPESALHNIEQLEAERDSLQAEVTALRELIRDYERAVRDWRNAPAGAMLSRRREERDEARDRLFAALKSSDPQGGGGVAAERERVLREVVEALEIGYHGQAPSRVHPADYVTKRFELEGHEGLAVRIVEPDSHPVVGGTKPWQTRGAESSDPQGEETE